MEITAQDSYVLIKFKEAGSAEFVPTFNNVTPVQLLLLAPYLDMISRSEIMRLAQQQAEEAERNRISLPSQPKVILPK